MTERHFNLVTEPWIKVLDVQNHPQEISLTELFQNADHYRQLAGEMPAQDLVILRFLLAILTTVYSRYDANGDPYEWMEVDPKSMRPLEFDEDLVGNGTASKDLLDTWQALFKAGRFSAVVTDYLHRYQNRFDLFDPGTPFYQVTRADYDSLVPANKAVAKGKGTVAVKQLNRTISESGNSINVFSPRADTYVNQISPAELTRWLLTYQSFTGVAEKTKIGLDKSSKIATGWLYELNPVFVKGGTLFETLLLNLVLDLSQIDPSQTGLTVANLDQHPVWETHSADYVRHRIDSTRPENISELYTTWSRMLHIEWDGGQPTIYSAKLAKPERQGAFIEPMTTWRVNTDDASVIPAMRWLNSQGKSMWRSFGQYVKIEGHNDYEPGIVAWLHYLKYTRCLSRDFRVHLATAGMISEANRSSQLPALEFADDFQLKAAVLFDANPRAAQWWPRRIEDVVITTNAVGTAVYQLAKNVANLRGVHDPKAVGDQISARFYDQLNDPFQEWLVGLSADDERNEKVTQWERTVKRIALTTAKELMRTVTPSEMQGKLVDGREVNIFTYYRIFNGKVSKLLNY